MTSSLKFNINTDHSTIYGNSVKITDILPNHPYQLVDYFPPQTLKFEDRIKLGVKALEKYGEADFAIYQRSYRLTKEESESVFQQAGHYAQDLATMEDLDESSCKQDVDLVRSYFPKATFSLLRTKEENHRSHPLVEIDGKRYYFYSHAYKGPVVNEEYIAQYKACQKEECRPDFTILSGKDRTVFLMEFLGEKTPDFRNEAHLKLIVELIVHLSLNKKGLDMLPCRLALKDQNLYCVDQKLNYVTFKTEIEAFSQNIQMLQSKIACRGYAEEKYLIAYVDKIAKTYEIPIFEKVFEGFKYSFMIREAIPPASLNNDQKVNLIAATLRKYGTKDLHTFARDYELCIEEQKEARILAGSGLIENTVIWEDEISSRFEELHEKAEKVLQKQGLTGKFKGYLNRVGNYKDILTVTINHEIYVVSEVDKKYIDQYKSQKEQEHRPDFLTFPIHGNTFLFLTKFMGSQTLDYSNPQHLDMVVELAMTFSSSKTTTIDFNSGNLLVEGNKLFYIDKDLTYSSSDHPQVYNLNGVFHSIDSNLHVAHERVKSQNYVKNKIRSMLDPNNPEDLKTLETFFPNEFAPITTPQEPSQSFEEAIDRLNLDSQQELPQSFEEFINRLDLDSQEDRSKLINHLPVLFKTMDDFLVSTERLATIASKLRDTAYVKECGDGYFEIVCTQVNDLFQAFIDSNKELFQAVLNSNQ